MHLKVNCTVESPKESNNTIVCFKKKGFENNNSWCSIRITVLDNSIDIIFLVDVTVLTMFL